MTTGHYKRMKVKSRGKVLTGVYTILGRGADGKPERIFYVSYYKNKKRIEEPVGREFKDEMTPEEAAKIRLQRIYGEQMTNKEAEAQERAKEDAERAQVEAELGRWTFDRVWSEYAKVNTHRTGFETDANRFKNHLAPHFGSMEPSEIGELDVERLKTRLKTTPAPLAGRKWDPLAMRRKGESKARLEAAKQRLMVERKVPYSDDTIRSILSLFERIATFAVDKLKCQGLGFRVKKPKGKNRIEDLTDEQLARVLKVCDEWPVRSEAAFILMEAHMGFRPGELRKLEWRDVDRERMTIFKRKPKEGTERKIVFDAAVGKILNSIYQEGNVYVFPGKTPSVPLTKKEGLEFARAIRDAAGLPKNYRPNYMFRDTFGTMMGSSQPAFIVSALMAHSNIATTQRYVNPQEVAQRAGARFMADKLASLRTSEPIGVEKEAGESA